MEIDRKERNMMRNTNLNNENKKVEMKEMINMKENYETMIGERCNSCVLPVSYEQADFRKGKCKFCRDFKAKTFKGAKALVKELDLKEKEQIGITVSGGKDSIYMWGQLVDLLGADRVVAFTYFKDKLSSPVALENVHKAQKKLGSELIEIHDNESIQYFRHNLKILLENPDPAAVRVLLCVGCRYGITENLYKRGEEMGIQKFVSGASYLELAPFKEELLKAKSEKGDIDEGLEKILSERPELDWRENLDRIRLDQKYKYKNNDSLENNFQKGYKYQLYDFDDYFENVPSETEKEVIKRYDWKKTNRSWHFDCRIEDLKDVFYFGILGYTELDFKLSAMVRYHLISREDALKQLYEQAIDIRNSFPRMVELLNELGCQDCIEGLKEFYESAKFLGGVENEWN